MCCSKCGKRCLPKGHPGCKQCKEQVCAYCWYTPGLGDGRFCSQECHEAWEVYRAIRTRALVEEFMAKGYWQGERGR